MFSSIDHLGLGYYNLNYSNSVGPVMIMINDLLICISEVLSEYIIRLRSLELMWGYISKCHTVIKVFRSHFYCQLNLFA